ncbi:hypothetical protein ACLB2K_019945 [Fragaria x ananassa]
MLPPSSLAALGGLDLRRDRQGFMVAGYARLGGSEARFAGCGFLRRRRYVTSAGDLVVHINREWKQRRERVATPASEVAKKRREGIRRDRVEREKERVEVGRDLVEREEVGEEERDGLKRE